MAVATASALAVELLPLDQIHANRNLREAPPAIPQLADSIRRHGLLTAILVDRRAEGGYELVAGFRRHAAAVMAGLAVVPAVVRDPCDERERVASQVAENVQRLDLTDLEQAQAMQQLLDLGASADDVAATVGATSEAVDAWTAVLRLPRKVHALIADGVLNMTDAVRLTAIADSRRDLAEALSALGQGDRMDRTVARILHRREVEAKRVASLTRLDAEGCSVIEAPTWDHFPVVSKTQRLGKGHGSINVSVAKHCALPCHAAFVSRDGETVYVCTNRRVHQAKPDAAGPEDRKAQLAAARAERKALRQAHASRLETLTTALRSGAFGATETMRHILTLMLWDGDPRDLEAACGLLDVAVPETSRFSSGLQALLNLAGGDVDRLITACLAAAIARAERHVSADQQQRHHYVASLHEALIAATGVHELTDQERAAFTERGIATWDDRRDLLPTRAG